LHGKKITELSAAASERMAATERLKAEQAIAAARLAEATVQSSKETTKTVGTATVGAGNSFSKVIYMVTQKSSIQ
jgi:hypothetical protein